MVVRKFNSSLRSHFFSLIKKLRFSFRKNNEGASRGGCNRGGATSVESPHASSLLQHPAQSLIFVPFVTEWTRQEFAATILGVVFLFCLSLLFTVLGFLPYTSKFRRPFFLSIATMLWFTTAISYPLTQTQVPQLAFGFWMVGLVTIIWVFGDVVNLLSTYWTRRIRKRRRL